MRASVVLAGLLAAHVHAVCDVAKLPDEPTVWRTLDGLVADAARRYAGASALEDTEYVGVVRRAGPGFTVTVYRGCRGHDRFRVRLERGVVALWHTHGRITATSGYFSPDDAALVLEARVPLYLLLPDRPARVLSLRDVERGPRRVGLARSLAARVLGYTGSAVASSR